MSPSTVTGVRLRQEVPLKSLFIARSTFSSICLLLFAVLITCRASAQACSPPTGSGVKVCFPGSNTTQANPVHYIAAASTTCTKGISAMGIYSAPNNKVYTVNGSSLDTFLPLTPGTYTTTVQEWDNCG